LKNIFSFVFLKIEAKYSKGFSDYLTAVKIEIPFTGKMLSVLYSSKKRTFRLMQMLYF